MTSELRYITQMTSSIFEDGSPQ